MASSNKREALINARLHKGLNRPQLAQQAGVTFEHIKSLEYGRVNPSAQLMLTLSKILEQPAEQLFSDVIS